MYNGKIIGRVFSIMSSFKLLHEFLLRLAHKKPFGGWSLFYFIWDDCTKDEHTKTTISATFSTIHLRRVGSASASYPRGKVFKYLLGDRLCWLRFLVVYLSPPPSRHRDTEWNWDTTESMILPFDTNLSRSSNYWLRRYINHKQMNKNLKPQRR